MTRRPVPFDIGPVHFVGIGGIGMSGIAEIMLRIGYVVQGSDARASAVTERLESMGATVFIGHDADADRRRHGGGVFDRDQGGQSGDRRRAREAAAAGAPRRDAGRADETAVFLVAVGGTHGKTTTTSMIAALLDAGGIDPTVVNGGIINAYGANAKVGAGDWMVVEADESDGTFLRLKSTVAVVTNIDPSTWTTTATSMW